jgi:hypothetical protein
MALARHVFDRERGLALKPDFKKPSLKTSYISR